MIQKKYVIFLLLLAQVALAKTANNKPVDSLSRKSFEYLQNRFEATIYDRSQSKIYVSAWLHKAKQEGANFRQLALAYKASIINAEKPLRILYADSMINYARRTKDDELIGSSYLTKGIICYNAMQHIKALDNYLIADTYIMRVNNPQLIYKLKYEIAKIKYYLGFYDEAIALLRECVTYFQEENDRAYLNSLHTLALCYTRTGKFKLASEINKLGIDQGKSFEDTGIEFYFNHSEGVNQCYSGNYIAAIKKLKSVVPDIILLKDYANEAVAYFYIGKSYWSLKDQQKAVLYFKKVDSIFQKENYTLPDLRQGYEFLIDYYKQNNDTRLQLFYINQLLKVDKLLAEDYKYLLKKVVKEYDTRELLQAKSDIENTVTSTRIFAIIIVLLMAAVIIYQFRKNKRNRKRFEELMNRDTGVQTAYVEAIPDDTPEETENDFAETEGSDKKSSPDITPKIEALIVKKLEKFELNKKYLEKDMTVAKMASILNTNPKYVTKIIAKHRGKGTIEYITDLKLDYIVEMLKTESRYRNYTHKALGEEAGFRTTQNFTRAFKSYTGITPTYFMYNLKKSANTDSSN